MPRPGARWLNSAVLGIGLASLFSDWSHEIATAAMPAFLATLGVSAAWLGTIEGVSDGLSSFAKMASGFYTDKLARRNGDSESDSPSDDKAALGVSVAPLTPDVASELGISKDAHGLVVQDVVPDGRAADAGIQSGDVIEAVNRQPVKTVDDLRTAIRKTTDRPALLLINRKGSEIFVTVRPANG